jgi:RHS repeat-associated protein
MISDAAQQTVWRWDQQEPFGVNVPDENPSGLGVFEFPMRLPGQYADSETGLHYNYFRDFDPALGRYIQGDPIGLRGGPGSYGYADQDPLRYTDSTGEFAAAIPAGAIIVLGQAAVIVAGVSVGVIIAQAIEERRKRGRDDPISGEVPYNPGRDCDGNCKPCKETVCWPATHKGSPQWHWIEWNQNKATCECFPKRGEGPVPPAGCKRIR